MKHPKKIRCQISVTLNGHESLGFEACAPAANLKFIKGIKMTYVDTPEGIMVEHGDDHVWININNIPHITWEKPEAKKTTKVANA